MKDFTIKYLIKSGSETIKRTTGFISESKESAISELKAMFDGVEKIISVKSEPLIDRSLDSYIEY